jgi:hypothetical protein
VNPASASASTARLGTAHQPAANAQPNAKPHDAVRRRFRITSLQGGFGSHAIDEPVDAERIRIFERGGQQGVGDVFLLSFEKSTYGLQG